MHVVALVFALARRWPRVVGGAVDPGWARTKMGGAGSPVDTETGQKAQAWLAVSDDPAALEADDTHREGRLPLSGWGATTISLY
jgi:hypothetical protein